MRDLHDETEVQKLLVACAGGNLGELAAQLHPDFKAFGVEDGLYISADRSIYLKFLARMVHAGAAKPSVEWIDVRSRIATGCIVQQDRQARRTIVLTLLSDQTGWRVITATFCAEDPAARDAHPAQLQ